MGLVKKQYGKAVLVDEVNKLLQDALHKYLVEEKLDVLGIRFRRHKIILTGKHRIFPLSLNWD